MGSVRQARSPSGMSRVRAGAAASAAVAVALALSGCFIVTDAGPMGGMYQGSTSESDPPGSGAERNMFDVGFTVMMIPHHEQAIDMADMILTKQGMLPGVVDLAGRIKAAQAPEIDLMESWLDDWGVGMPGVNGMNGMGHGGMMSDAELEALDRATGSDATRLFLEQMIEHHQGAIDMAEREIDRGRYAPTIDLARRIVTAQEAEIVEMERLLAEHGNPAQGY